jgi:hypothetical protein
MIHSIKGSGEHVVTLSADTLQRISAIAAYRQEQKRKRGQINQKISKSSDLEIEICGLRGEFSVAQYYNIEPNLMTEADGGVDLIINGKTVDVKYTKYGDGDLVFTSRSHFKADIAILAVEETATRIELKGWIDRKRFLAECLYHKPHKEGERFTTFMGYGMTQPDSKLRPCDKCDSHYSPINPMKPLTVS